jgi:hypothetical protein
MGMNKIKKILLFTIILFTIMLLSGCFFLSQHPKEWTLMLYLDGDEPAMQQDFIAAFHEMIARNVGSTEKINVVIQFDRIPGRADFDGWTIAHRFYYTPGMEPVPNNAVKDWGDGLGGREVNMADPKTLSDFINWAHKEYPAKRYALMIGDHGYGWRGLVIDETSEGQFMTLKELSTALETAKTDFELLMLDACLMQMIEVLHEIQNSGSNVVVGSENSGTTWPLADIISYFSSDYKHSPEEFGTAVVDFYNQAHPGETSITLSAVDMAYINDLSRQFKEMVDTILSDDPFTTVQEKAQIVLNTLDQMVIYKRNGSDWTDAGGLSIYWPQMQQGFMPQDFFYNYIPQNTAFAEDTHWRDFLYIYYNHMSYPDVIENEIYHIRSHLKEFEDPNIDLYQFCKAIVDYSE